jgi:gamma-glutamylcyclotransferase (GGCT)/AIG2-like uncharacterized protein YtfP
MTLHFAYGANMSRDVMARYAPGAEPIGPAELPNHRFIITGDGYASAEPAQGSAVHGVLWRITPRDRVSLDVWENTKGGLYSADALAVRCDGRSAAALVYRARPSGEGRPRPGYMDLVIEAAREWKLPEHYIGELHIWTLERRRTADVRPGFRKLEDFW